MTTRFENAYSVYFSVPLSLVDYEAEDWDEVEKRRPMWGFSVRWNTDFGYTIIDPLRNRYTFEDDDNGIERLIFNSAGEQPLAVADIILKRWFEGLGETPPRHVEMHARASLSELIAFWRAKLGDGQAPFRDGTIAIPSA